MARETPKLDFILKVLVGSRAHGLHHEHSDYDYRGVFVQPTAAILGLSGSVRTTSWIEGDKHLTEPGSKIDDTAWEIGHFLKLATHCNPSILEVFAAPIVEFEGWTLSHQAEGRSLRALLPYVWNPKGVYDAFVGYGLNQRKKFLDDKDARPTKYAVAYLRTLLQAERLLIHGVLAVDFQYHEEFQTLQLFKAGLASKGQVIDKCQEWERRVYEAAANCDHKPDLARVEEFLLSVRRNHFA